MKKNVMIYNNPLQPNHQKNKQKKTGHQKLVNLKLIHILKPVSVDLRQWLVGPWTVLQSITVPHMHIELKQLSFLREFTRGRGDGGRGGYFPWLLLRYWTSQRDRNRFNRIIATSMFLSLDKLTSTVVVSVCFSNATRVGFMPCLLVS